jgi:hypothetical protein
VLTYAYANNHFASQAPSICREMEANGYDSNVALPTKSNRTNDCYVCLTPNTPDRSLRSTTRSLV